MNKVAAKEARCHGCGKTASRLMIAGWLFECVPCKRGWGHPQFHTRQWAIDCLRMARSEDASKRLPDSHTGEQA